MARQSQVVGSEWEEKRKKEKTNLADGNTKTPKGNWIGY
jgi:hypothetical protein